VPSCNRKLGSEKRRTVRPASLRQKLVPLAKMSLRVVDDQPTAIRELTLCVSMHPFAVCQRWQFPSSAHFHPWSGRILRPQRGGSPPWFGLHADNFGGLPLEQLPRRSGTIDVTGGYGEACG